MGNLTLYETDSSNYKVRTEENIKNSHLTIAIAFDFDSFGEKLTKELAIKEGKKYIAVYPDGNPFEKAERICEKINEFDLPNNFTLNIAGNGLSTISGRMTQQEADIYTYNLIKAIHKSSKLKNKIHIIRSGGQTGFDEAGAKAGLRLGIDTIVCMPNGFRMRNQEGKDITMLYEHAKLRFEIPKSKILYIDMDGVLCNYSKNFKNHIEKNPKILYPQSQYGFFLELEPIPGSIEAFLRLSSMHDVWILTAPSDLNPLSLAEKNYWIRMHLGQEYTKRLILSPNKSLLKGDYLIDDNQWTNEQGDFEGELILIGSDKFPNLHSTLEYFENI